MNVLIGEGVGIAMTLILLGFHFSNVFSAYGKIPRGFNLKERLDKDGRDSTEDWRYCVDCK